MSYYNLHEIKNGSTLLVDKQPIIIIESKFIKPGKGQAFVKAKIKNLNNKKIINKTFKNGDVLKKIFVEDVDVFLSYFDNPFFIFINKKTFEQYTITEEIMKNYKKWIKENMHCKIKIFNNKVIDIQLENPMCFTVDQILENNTNTLVKNGYKMAKLENGTLIQVPIFIEKGNKIKINTQSNDYISRTNS